MSTARLAAEEELEKAKERLSRLKEDPGNEIKLKLYGLFKQVNVPYVRLQNVLCCVLCPNYPCTNNTLYWWCSRPRSHPQVTCLCRRGPGTRLAQQVHVYV